MKITYYGHACFGFEINKNHILIDPFIIGNPLAASINIDNIKADYIFVSHGHADHIGDTVEIAKKNDATVISNFEIINWLTSKGVKHTHSMNIGGNKKFDFGKVKFFKADHSSSMPDGSPGGNPGGFIFETCEGNFYFAGDTGLTYDMKLIGEYKKIDFAMLPIGDNYTMGVDNAIIASSFINCNKIIGMHFDSFSVIKINKNEAVQKFKNAGKELILMDIGESIELSNTKA
ncbi:MAG: metal-dependent hydrolase [Bacteroidales bacterium]|jgi:L-ascorbate metabolism protein UlaG (beta-lactamase superfamily)